jgi:Carboxypeptidase regulatory-like domain
MRKLVAAVLCSAVATIGVPASGFAAGPVRAAKQSSQNQSTGGVQGVAKNAQQQNLPRVRVHVRDADGKLVAVGTTNTAGEFTFAGLNPGTFTIEIVNTAGEIVGTASVTINAGAMAMVTLTATAVGTIAAGAGGGAGLLGLGTLGTVAVVGAASTAAIVAVEKTKKDASPSR